MKCKNCRLPTTKEDKICPHCGYKLKKTWKYTFLSLISIFLVIGIAFTIFLIKDHLIESKKSGPQKEPIEKIKPIDDPDEKTPKETTPNEDKDKETDSLTSQETEKSDDKYIIGEEVLEKNQRKSEKQVMHLEQKEDITNYIERAKQSVFTITTPEMQGSGFLFDWNGAIVTNAHVVEGWTEAKVVAADNTEYNGYLIGYSNETDVAVIHVPELKGKKPFPHDTSTDFNIGEEVVALGSPNGEANSATMGFITGKDRDFIIGSFIYNNLYQISAPIAPGSSGGPLISKQTEQIIAINSAQSTTDHSIGFSIPMFQVAELIQSWIDRPMTESELFRQFYGENGDLIIGDEWDAEEGYFDDGDYSDDEDHYDYWEYEYDEYWDEKNGEEGEISNNPPNIMNEDETDNDSVKQKENLDKDIQEKEQSKVSDLELLLPFSDQLQFYRDIA